jgi:GNAT superfamily N-acetyltransferase
MPFQVIPYTPKLIEASLAIWNEVVRDGIAFPQEDELTAESGDAFFSMQTYTGLARNEETGEIAGLYILHPNNVGRCGHICNASYAVASNWRGHHVGEMLVLDSISRAKEFGFRILQFNAVVRTNEGALALYRKLGFVQLGVIPDGFRKKDGTFEDIIPHYRIL